MSHKYAVLVSGQIRDICPRIYNLSLKSFFKGLNTDFYVTAWDKSGQSMNHKRTTVDALSSIDVNKFIEVAFTDLKVKSIQIESLLNWETNLSAGYKTIFYDNTENSFITKNAMPQLYLIEKCYDSVLQSDYDFFVRIRFDNLFIMPLATESLLSGDIFHINFGRAFLPNRIYDIFFICNKQSAEIVMRTYSRISYIYNLQDNSLLEKRDACNLLYKSIYSNPLIRVISLNYRYTDVFRPVASFALEKYFADIFFWGLTKHRFPNVLRKFIMSFLRYSRALNLFVLLFFIIKKYVNRILWRYKKLR